MHLFGNDFLLCVNTDVHTDRAGAHPHKTCSISFQQVAGPMMIADFLLRVETRLIIYFFPLDERDAFELLQIACGDAAHR